MLPAESTIEIVVARDPDTHTTGQMAAALSADEWQRADCFVLRRDRDRFVARRARLRGLLGARLGVRAASVCFSSGCEGKPALAAPFATSGIAFNLSHCEDVTVYAFARGTDVGVDVEAIRVIDDADRIAAMMFSRLEYHEYTRLPATKKPAGFLNCWTRKEALVKALGTGLSHPLGDFDVSLTPGEPARLLRLGTTAGSSGWRLHSFVPAPGFIAAVAAEPAS